VHRMLRVGPVNRLVLPPVDAIPNRPMSVAGEASAATPHRVPTQHVNAGG
jgi:hypothetical protein